MYIEKHFIKNECNTNKNTQILDHKSPFLMLDFSLNLKLYQKFTDFGFISNKYK